MSQNVYSTTEQVVGTWIDGEPIYRKVIVVTSQKFASSQIDVPHNISNLGEVVSFNYSMKYTFNGRWYVNWDAINTKNIEIGPQNVIFRPSNGGDAVFSPLYITLEYTKTS